MACCVSSSTLLVFFEDGATRYFHTPNNQAFLRAIAYVLKQRLDNGWYEGDSNDLRFKTRLMSFLDQINAADFSNENEVSRLTGLAWDLLKARSQFEYEGYDIQHFETPH